MLHTLHEHFMVLGNVAVPAGADGPGFGDLVKRNLCVGPASNPGQIGDVAIGFERLRSEAPRLRRLLRFGFTAGRHVLPDQYRQFVRVLAGSPGAGLPFRVYYQPAE